MSTSYRFQTVITYLWNINGSSLYWCMSVFVVLGLVSSVPNDWLWKTSNGTWNLHSVTQSISRWWALCYAAPKEQLIRVVGLRQSVINDVLRRSYRTSATKRSGKSGSTYSAVMLYTSGIQSRQSWVSGSNVSWVTWVVIIWRVMRVTTINFTTQLCLLYQTQRWRHERKVPQFG